MMRQLDQVSLSPAALRAAVSLGSAAPTSTPQDALAPLQEVPPRQLIDFWYQHRVLRLATHRLGQLDSPPARRVLAAGADRIEATARRVAELRRIWKALGEECDRLGVRVAGIKGMTMNDRYDGIGPRDFGDIDLMAQKTDDAWRLAAWLRRNGWDYLAQELPWLKRTAKGELYGQVILAGCDGARVDIHFGGYSVRHNAWIPTATERPTGLTVADLNENFGYLLGNAAGDHVIRVKEMNDLSVYLSAEDFDVTAARKLVTRTCLEGYLDALLTATDEWLALTEQQRERLRSLRVPGVDAERPGFGVPRLTERRRAIVRHAWQYQRRSGAGLGLWSAATAAIYYRMPLRRAVLPVPGLPRPRLTRRMRSDRCVRLVPVPAAAAPVGTPELRPEQITGTTQLHRLRTGAREFVAANGDLFIPTVYFLISSTVLRRATAVASAVTPAGTAMEESA